MKAPGSKSQAPAPQGAEPSSNQEGSSPTGPPRINRRLALHWITGAIASIPMLERGSLGAEPAEANPRGAPASRGRGYGPDPDLLRNYHPGDLWPLTFSDEQRRLVTVLCDIIMPADESSPSASSLSVHDFVDEWISSPYPGQKSDRTGILKGLDWLDEEAGRRGEKTFISLSDSDQLAVCKELARLAKADSRKHPGSFFLRLRNLVAGGYYTTPAGMKDIGYRGNVPMADWNGPPPEVLAKLGLEPQ